MQSTLSHHPTTYYKMPYHDVRQLMKSYTPTAASLALAEENPAPAAFLAAAQQQGLHADAVALLAHGLPLKEAVWWGYCCAQEIPDWGEQEQAALESVSAWVVRSGETERRKAGEAAQSTGLESPAGWLAQAVFWSTGSMLAPDQPPMPAPPFLYAQALGGAVTLMAVLPDGAQAAARYPRFLQLGESIARGGKGQ